MADINFNLKQGQAIALIGTNGSGKSTLLRTIVQLLKPQGGKLLVFGMPPGTNPRRIAYLGQYRSSRFILPLRAIDVVRMGRFPLRGLMGQMNKQDDEIVQNAMRPMGIEKLADMPLRFLSGSSSSGPTAQELAHRPTFCFRRTDC